MPIRLPLGSLHVGTRKSPSKDGSLRTSPPAGVTRARTASRSSTYTRGNTAEAARSVTQAPGTCEPAILRSLIWLAIVNSESMPRATAPNKPRRRYRSPVRQHRARQTRQRILAAATALFATRGYSATSIRTIAEAAAVSVPTVELAFGSKPRLLKAAIDVAIAGDDQPLPMLQRDWAARARATATSAELLDVFCSVLRDSMTRSAPLVVAAFALADSDSDMGMLAEELAQQRAATVSWLVDALVARSALRTGISRELAVDSVWIFMDPLVFQRMTRYRGWTPHQYVAWFRHAVLGLFQ